MSNSVIPRPGGRSIGIRSTGNISGVRPASQPAVPNFSGIASGFDAVRDVANNVADQAFNDLERDAQRRGREAGRRAAERLAGGKEPIVDLSDVEQDTAFGSAFTDTAAQVFRDQIVSDATVKASEVQAENPADPQAFAKEFGQFVDGQLANVPEQIAREAEPELRQLQSRGLRNTTVNQVEQAREQTRQSVFDEFDRKAEELQGLVRNGEGDTERARTLRTQLDGHFNNALNENLVTENEVRDAQREAGRALEETEVIGRTERLVEGANLEDPDELARVFGQIDSEVSKADVPAERKDELRNRALGVVKQQSAQQGRIEQAREAQRQQRQTQNFLELRRRKALPGEPAPTLDEIERMRKSGAISNAQAAQFFESIGSARRAEAETQQERRSTLLLQDFENGRLSFADVRERLENGEMTFSDFADARSTALEREADERARLEEVGVQRWLGNRHKQLDLRPNQFRDLVTNIAAEGRGDLTPQQARAEAEDYRQAFNERVDKQRIRRRAFQQFNQQGAVRGGDEREQLVEALGPVFDPTRDTTPEDSGLTPQQQTADAVTRAGFVPDSLASRFANIESEDEETVTRLVQTYNAIRSADARGTGGAILNDSLSSGTIRKMDTLSTTLRQADTVSAALEQANKAVNDNSSTDRRLAAMVPQDARGSETEFIRRNVPRVLSGEGVGGSGGLDNPVPGPIDVLGAIGRASGLLEGNDQRFQPVIAEAERRGIDLSEQRLPGHMRDRIARRARTLIETGRIGPDGGISQAIKTGAAQVFREFGPELTDDGGVRFVREPIVTQANRQTAAFDIQQGDVKQDFKFQARRKGLEPPPGFDSMQDVPIRFDFIEGSASSGEPEYRVMYEDPQEDGLLQPLTTEAEDGTTTQVTYNFDFDQSVQKDAQDAVMEHGLAGQVQLPFDIGDETIREFVGNAETDALLRFRRIKNELNALARDPDLQAAKENSERALEKKRELQKMGRNLVERTLGLDGQEGE